MLSTALNHPIITLSDVLRVLKSVVDGVSEDNEAEDHDGNEGCIEYFVLQQILVLQEVEGEPSDGLEDEYQGGDGGDDHGYEVVVDDGVYDSHNYNRELGTGGSQIIDLMEKVKKNKRKKYSEIDLNVNPMRRAEKLFKYSSIRETDWGLLFDLEGEKVERVMVQGKEVIRFQFPEGAYLVRSFLSLEEQILISQQCLNQFVRKPYRTNLSGEKGLYKDQSHSEIESADEEEEGQAQKPLSIKAENKKPEDKEEVIENAPTPYDFNEKIRWSNLGYNYDWTNRNYPKTKTTMPDCIAKIAGKANSLFNQVTNQGREYAPEAVIVNYYKQRDAMTAHLDDAEEDQESPIYSFAFGLSCVFLIGESHKEAEPLAVKLESGDLFIMSGKSRRSYHGVPRVIASTFAKELEAEIGEQNDSVPNTKAQTIEYLRSHRININIRQVYNKSDSI